MHGKRNKQTTKVIMAKAPAFQFYASDFLTDTQSWETEEVGIYIRLLANEWVNGPLPNDEKRLARIAGCDTETFKNHWVIVGFKFLVNGEGELYNEKLEGLRYEDNAFREKQRLNGSKGGRPRKTETQKKPNENPKVNPKHNPNESSSSSSSIYINKEEGTHFFYINGELIKGKPSERILSEHNYSTEQLMFNKFRGLKYSDILERLDQEYPGYQFNDEMHLRNSFKTIGEKLLEEITKKQKQSRFNNNTQSEQSEGYTIGAKPKGAVNHG